MSRPLAALALSAALLAGCASSPDTQDATPLVTDTDDINTAIHAEVNRLLLGGESLLAPTEYALGEMVTIVQPGDTALNLLRRADAQESLYYDLPAEDRNQLAKLSPGDEVALLRDASGQITGMAIKQEGTWHTAKRGQSKYRLTQGLASAMPTLSVHDLPLKGSIESTLNSSELPGETREALGELLAQGFPVERFDTPGWLRLRIEHNLIDGVEIGTPSLVSAALSTGDGPAFMIRYQAGAGNIAYYNGNGERLEPNWIGKPVRGEYRITSEFNPRRQHPVTGRVRPHNGRDFAARSGTPVIAASDGIVAHAGWQGSWGRLIVLRHPNGLETRYAHLRSIDGVSEGETVTRGQQIGQVGTSGLSTGPHLHFEVYQRGIAQNPATFSPDKMLATTDGDLNDRDYVWFSRYRTLETASLSQDSPSQPTAWFANRDHLTGQGGPDADD